MKTGVHRAMDWQTRASAMTGLPKVRNITRSGGGFFSLDVHHFYPEDITVSWAVIQPPSSSQPRPIKESSIVKHKNQDGTLNATSTSESLRGLIRENEPYIVTAVVEHNKLKRPVQREWNSDDKENKDFLARPEVELIQPSKLFVSEQTQLQCRMSHFYPNELALHWFQKGNGKEEFSPITNSGRFRIPDSRSELQTDKTFTHNAILEITPSLEDQGSEVICRVEHPSLEKPIERATGPLQVMVKPKVQQPIQLPIDDSGNMVASFSLSNYYPEDIKVTWTCGLNQEQKPSAMQTFRDVLKNSDGTFTTTSQCTIPGHLFEDPQFPVRVTWEHPSMEVPEYREISAHSPDFPWHPRIEDLNPLILQANRQNTVKCKISGYFSENIRMTWLERKGEHVTDCSHNKYDFSIINTGHSKRADNSFTCTSSLSFTPTSSDELLEFICRVEHPSLEQPIERSTGPPRRNAAPVVTDPLRVTVCESGEMRCSIRLEKFFPKKIDLTWSFEMRTWRCSV
ncbi:uncharacterized protein [Hyperolius riggenbachi]|uniref:uncharacterized protein n=1 Tax=Hyperolius riggenbachi TaxID=752182 RepID=UPI0035A277AD